MQIAGLLNGGAVLVKRYKSGSTFTVTGGYATVTVDGGAGIVLGLATTVADQVGYVYDTATYSTTQGDAEAVVAVAVNPDLILKLRMGRTATAATQLQITTNSAADTAGTAVTITAGDDPPNAAEKDEGTLVCVSGANLGQSRKITTTSATVYTVTVPFLNDIASGDQFIAVPWTPADIAGDNINLTTNLEEARQDIAVGTGADLRVFELQFDTASVSHARRNSFVYALFDDSIWRETT